MSEKLRLAIHNTLARAPRDKRKPVLQGGVYDLGPFTGALDRKALHRRRIRIGWTCSDLPGRHHHRFYWVARLCGWWQYVRLRWDLRARSAS